MNTGGGKTAVGLLVAQSSLAEGAGPAVYLVPDHYLADQVMTEAVRLGIAVTDNARDMD
jgi:replicative superfamily II helicase